MLAKVVRAGSDQKQKEQSMLRKVRSIVGINLVVPALAFGLALGGINAHAAEKNLVDTAKGAGQFKTLAAALDAAGLASTLKGKGPFTIFAPTDAAFAKLPAETLKDLLKPENKQQLVAILTYHVVPGKIEAAKIVELDEAKSVNGKTIDIEVKNGTAMVNDAKVTKTDIVASNGIIHVIDTVIMPPKS
jgi:uncharacterized surface protein with fasciclin (FAS1) repeats